MVLALVPGHSLKAQHKGVPADSSGVKVRSLPAGSLQKYRDDEAFNYKQERPRGTSLWARFWFWVFRQLDKADTKGTGLVFRFVLWGLCIFIIVYAILKFTGMSGIGLFAGNRKLEMLGYTVTEDDIYAIDFPQSIAEATGHKNYRLAIRLLYLQTLRKLADREMIRWKLNKTNDVYTQELAGSNYYNGFAWLTRAYDYAWYGDFPVQEEQFAEVQQHFQTFQHQLPV